MVIFSKSTHCHPKNETFRDPPPPYNQFASQKWGGYEYFNIEIRYSLERNG